MDASSAACRGSVLSVFGKASRNNWLALPLGESHFDILTGQSIVTSFELAGEDVSQGH